MPQGDDIEQGWFVARTQPRRENWAAENCARQGAESYLPQILEQNVKTFRSGKEVRVSRLKPLFPGYLFIRTTGQWRFLMGTLGIISLIKNGEQPSTISQDIIDDLRSRESHGLVQLPDAARLFARDDAVLLKEGPFQGLKGVVSGYNGFERVRVLLDFLGRKTTVLIAEEALEPV